MTFLCPIESSETMNWRKKKDRYCISQS